MMRVFRLEFVVALVAFHPHIIVAHTAKGFGFQNSGGLAAIAIDEINDANSLYALVSDQTNYPVSTKVTKISALDGSFLWTSVSGSSTTPCCIAFDEPNAVYTAGTTWTGEVYASKMKADKGSLVWEAQYTSSSHQSSSAKAVAAGYGGVFVLTNSWMSYIEGNPEYKLLPERSITNVNENRLMGHQYDFVTVFDEITGKLLWSVGCSPNTTSSSLYQTSVFSKIEVISGGNVQISGVMWDQNTWTNVEVIQVLDARNNGSLLSETTKPAGSYYYQNPLEITTDNGDYYIGQYAYAQVYGYSGGYFTYGYTVTKNLCSDGYYVQAVSPTTSMCQACYGLSWTMYGDTNHIENIDTGVIAYSTKDIEFQSDIKPLSYGSLGYDSCDYVNAKVNNSFLVFIFFGAAVIIFGYFGNVDIVQSIGIFLSTLSYSCDLVYIFSAIFANYVLFGLACTFLFGPFLYFVFDLSNGKYSSRFRELFQLNSLMPRWPIILLKNLRHVPYWGDTRLLPASLAGHSDDYFILCFCWIAAILLQLVYIVVFGALSAILISPWLIIHGPYLISVFLVGYLLHIFNVLPHGRFRLSIINLIWKIPKAVDTDVEGEYELPERTQDIVNWESSISAINVMFMCMIPQLIIQAINTKKMDLYTEVAIISWIVKGLFILNLINRISILYGSTFFGLLVSGFNRSQAFFFSSVRLRDDIESGSAHLIGSELSSSLVPILRSRVQELEGQVEELKRLLEQERRDRDRNSEFRIVSSVVERNEHLDNNNSSLNIAAESAVVVEGESDEEHDDIIVNL